MIHDLVIRGLVIRGLGILIVVVALAAPARAGTFYDGLKAYNIADYRAAWKIWQPLAERNNGNAQSGVGLLYYRGLGIGQNTREAARWFSLAANNGVVQAQMFLAMMLFHGDGVKRSPVWAYVWSDVAVTGGVESAVELRDQIEAGMTDGQVREAQNLSARWQDSHFPAR